MNLDDLKRLYQAATDHFRLETLPQYLVPQEEAEFATWKRGERHLDTPDDAEYLAHIRDTTAAGQRWWRVRLLDYPLAEYSRFELHAYQANAAAGEDVYVADRAWHLELADLHEDFWLYDSATAVRMVYDEEGHFLYPELREDTERYLEMRDRALRHTIPLADYLRKYEPDLIADPP
jgi:hypothetical protein